MDIRHCAKSQSKYKTIFCRQITFFMMIRSLLTLRYEPICSFICLSVTTTVYYIYSKLNARQQTTLENVSDKCHKGPCNLVGSEMSKYMDIMFIFCAIWDNTWLRSLNILGFFDQELISNRYSSCSCCCCSSSRSILPPRTVLRSRESKKA